MTSLQWNPIETAPEGEAIETLSAGGRRVILICENGLWWFQDRSMYIYYPPKFWRPINVG